VLQMNRARRLVASVLAAALVWGLGTALTYADEKPLARVVIMPELIPDVVRQLVPFTVDLAAARVGPQTSKIKIAGLVYCGDDRQGGAWALGVAAPESAAVGSNVLSTSDCQAPLPAIAQRLAQSAEAADWVEVMKAHVTWTPWMLRFAIADAAGASRNERPAPSLKDLGKFNSFATSNLQILPPPGQENRFDIAIGFRESSIVVALFPSGRVSNPEPYLQRDPLLEAEIADAPSRANAVADAQYGFINALLRLYAPSFEIPLQLQGMTQSLTAKNISASGGDNAVTVAGKVELGNISYDAAVHCEGDDLAVRQVTLAAPAVNCNNNNDVVAQLQCQGQQAASGALGATLTNIYQGQRFHYSTVDRPLRFTLGDIEFAAKFEALRSSSRGSTVSEDGNVTLERIGVAPAGTH
jgi:hypothetical protein